MDLIAAELTELGTTPTAARLIAALVATTYVDGTADHGGDDLADLGGEARASAGVITMILTRVTRADGGAACPDVARPAAFAAFAVRAALASLN